MSKELFYHECGWRRGEHEISALEKKPVFFSSNKYLLNKLQKTTQKIPNIESEQKHSSEKFRRSSHRCAE
jgi:hypothetical protein